MYGTFTYIDFKNLTKRGQMFHTWSIIWVYKNIHYIHINSSCAILWIHSPQKKWCAFQKNIILSEASRDTCTDGVCVPLRLPRRWNPVTAKWQRNWRRQAAIPPFPLVMSSEIRAEMQSGNWNLKIKEQWSWMKFRQIVSVYFATFSNNMDSK